MAPGAAYYDVADSAEAVPLAARAGLLPKMPPSDRARGRFERDLVTESLQFPHEIPLQSLTVGPIEVVAAQFSIGLAAAGDVVRNNQDGGATARMARFLPRLAASRRNRAER